LYHIQQIDAKSNKRMETLVGKFAVVR